MLKTGDITYFSNETGDSYSILTNQLIKTGDNCGILTNQLIKTVFLSTAGNSSTAGKKKITLHTFPTELAIPLKFNFSVSTYQNRVIFLWEKTYLVVDFGDLIIIFFSHKTFDFQCSPDQSS